MGCDKSHDLCLRRVRDDGEGRSSTSGKLAQPTISIVTNVPRTQTMALVAAHACAFNSRYKNRILADRFSFDLILILEMLVAK